MKRRKMRKGKEEQDKDIIKKAGDFKKWNVACLGH